MQPTILTNIIIVVVWFLMVNESLETIDNILYVSHSNRSSTKWIVLLMQIFVPFLGQSLYIMSCITNQEVRYIDLHEFFF